MQTIVEWAIAANAANEHMQQMQQMLTSRHIALRGIHVEDRGPRREGLALGRVAVYCHERNAIINDACTSVCCAGKIRVDAAVGVAIIDACN